MKAVEFIFTAGCWAVCIVAGTLLFGPMTPETAGIPSWIWGFFMGVCWHIGLMVSMDSRLEAG